MNAKITFLGTGTSHGIPKINCNCKVCSSTNILNHRLRCSLLLEFSDINVLIDTSADFRTQALKFKISHIDSILFTHEHADHLHGIDDIRAYQTKSSNPIQCFGPKSLCQNLVKRFPYMFENIVIGGGVPKIVLNPVDKIFKIKDIEFEPILVEHGQVETYGYKFLNVAYIPDVKYIPENSLKLLTNLNILIIDALRYRPHSTHFCLNDAIEVVKILKPKQTFFTHIDHEIEHEECQNFLNTLNLNISIAYDGLTLLL